MQTLRPPPGEPFKPPVGRAASVFTKRPGDDHDQLKLELSPAKALITHGRTQAARFLGNPR